MARKSLSENISRGELTVGNIALLLNISSATAKKFVLTNNIKHKKVMGREIRVCPVSLLEVVIEKEIEHSTAIEVAAKARRKIDEASDAREKEIERALEATERMIQNNEFPSLDDEEDNIANSDANLNDTDQQPTPSKPPSSKRNGQPKSKVKGNYPTEEELANLPVDDMIFSG